VKGSKGFTLIELMVVIAILGVLAASAFPTYRTFRRRAVGAEATTIMKQLINAEIMYNLQHPEKGYFAGNDDSDNLIKVYHDGSGTSNKDITQVWDNLHVKLPVGHFLDFQIRGIPDPLDSDLLIQVIIQIDANFPIFRDGSKHIMTTIDKDGTVNTIVFP